MPVEGCATNRGLNPDRPVNEDYYYVAGPTMSGALPGRGRLYIVADGMGGSVAGEVASKLAVRTVTERYYRGQWQGPLQTLAAAMQEAARAVYAESRSRPELKGMGSTLTALVLHESRAARTAYIAHVGDSRCYVIRGHRIRQLTEDHSLVGEQVRQGRLTPQQARIHDQRHVITRNLGMQPSVEASYTEMPVAHDDIFVLTSDGVHGELTDQEIAEIAAGANPQRSAERVIDRVLARGAPDNATVVIVPMEERAAVSVLRHRPALARLALFAGVPLLVLILIGIALFAPGHPPAAAPGPSSEETGPRADSGESTTQAPADTTAERTAAMFRPSSPSQARRQQQPAGQRRGRQSRDSTARRPSDTAVQPAEGLDSSGTQRSPQIVPLASPARTLGQQGQDSVVACSLWRVASRCLVDDSVPDPHPLRQTVMEMGAAVGNKQWGAVRGLYNRFDRERNRR